MWWFKAHTHTHAFSLSPLRAVRSCTAAGIEDGHVIKGS